MKIGIRDDYKEKAINPQELIPGTWLLVSGITWVKKKNEKWKCRAFDIKTKLCRIYKYRPPLCRGFQCKFARKRIRKRAINYLRVVGDSIYTLTFTQR